MQLCCLGPTGPFPSPEDPPPGTGSSLPLRAYASKAPSIHQVLQTLAAGAVCGFIGVVLALSLGNLLFFGEMRDFVPVALGMSLFTTMVVGAIAALTSPIRGVVSIAEEIPVVAIAGPAAAITATMIDHLPREDIAVTIVVAAMLSTIATGVALLLLGYFRLGRTIRYIPFPVIAGFLAGTGWLIMMGGLSVMIGDAVSPGSIGLLLDPTTALKCALGVGFAGLIAVLVARSPSPLAFPIAIFAALVLFNLAVAVLDIPTALLRVDGWVMPMLAGAALWPPIIPADLASVEWGAILPTAVMLPGIIVVSVMAIMMNASGIELATRRDVDLDRELLSVGLQNVVAGSGGGIPGYPAVSLSVLADRFGAGNRGVGIVAAALAGCVLFLGKAVLDLVPTPLLGSVLVWIGATVTYEWLVQTARRLTALEYIVVVLIFLVIVFVSLGVGILVGLVAAVVLFVVEYGRIDSVRQILGGQDYQSTFEASGERRDTLRRFGTAIMIVQLQGFIFFGSSDRLRKRLEDRVMEELRTLIIDFRRVTGVDSSAVVSFVRLSQLAERQGLVLLLAGMSKAVERAMLRGGLSPGGHVRVETDINQGLVWSENRLLAAVAPALDAERPRSLKEIAFGVVNDEALAETLGRYFEPVSLLVGDHLIEDGTPSDEMYFVESGRGAVSIKGPGGSPVRIATVGPGAIVGEVAFYLGSPRNASILIESPMTAWRFSRASLARLKAEIPALGLRFHEGLAAMMAARITTTNRLVGFLSE